VTVRRRAPFSARRLALTLVEERALHVANAAPTGLRALTRRPTRSAAHPLSRHCRRSGRERTAALSASTAAHPPSLRRTGALFRWPGGSRSCRSRARSRGAVDHDPAGRWISIRLPLKPRVHPESTADALTRVAQPGMMSSASAPRLPWASAAHLVRGDEESFALMGPAVFGSRGPYLQALLSCPSEGDARAESKRWRENEGCAPLTSFGDAK
jgi:hypothetical protein